MNSMGSIAQPIGLTPLDHITAKVYLPYMLYFNTDDPSTAVRTLQNGINKLTAEIPWLAGNVVRQSEPQTRGFVYPPTTSHDVPMLKVKYFDRDEEFCTHPKNEYFAVPVFIPASQQRPVLRFQVNAFPSKIIVVMSFMHMVFDGSGAGIVLQALSECCQAAAAESSVSIRMPITEEIVRTAIDYRREVSDWPSKCKTRLDHSVELGPPAFDSNFSSEQWGAMESVLSSAAETYRVTFSPDKIAHLKALCAKRLPQLNRPFDPAYPFSSNDIITAALGISFDRVMHPNQTGKDKPANMFMVADLRRRINPPLPETYLGNMIYPIWRPIHCRKDSEETSPGEESDLLHLTQLALELRTGVTSSINETLGYSASAAVAESGDWYQMEGKPADVVMTSWRHLKVFALEFGPGLGHVEDFESGFSLIPGACIMLPQRTRELQPVEPVPWEASVTLRPGDYDAFVKDPLLSQILADS